MKYSCLLFALLLHLSVQRSFAQIPSSEMMYTHKCSEAVTGDLTSAPPLQWNMPLPVFQTYFAIDSICRMNLPTNYQLLLRQYSGLLTLPLVDSISKYLYRTIDYDPLLFYKYIWQGQYLASNYVNKPTQFYKLFNQLRLNNEYGVNSFLAISAGIYHIVVTSVTIDTAYLCPPKQSPVLVTCIKADVIATIKGSQLTNNHLDPETGSFVPGISFSYANYWQTKSYKSTDVILVADTSLIKSEAKTFGTFHSPSIGDEYMLFAFLNFESHTSPNGTIYNIWPNAGSQPEGGLFPIVNGNVLDSSNYFGWGDSIPVSEFLDQLNNHIQTYLLN